MKHKPFLALAATLLIQSLAQERSTTASAKLLKGYPKYKINFEKSPSWATTNEFAKIINDTHQRLLNDNLRT